MFFFNTSYVLRLAGRVESQECGARGCRAA